MTDAFSMVTAYAMYVDDDNMLHITQARYPDRHCTPPFKAVSLLRKWRYGNTPLYVQGGDMKMFWELWEATADGREVAA